MANSVLILNGSPRKKGNTAFLIGKLIEGICESQPDTQIETVNLHTLKIGPCRACNGCRKEDRVGQYCVYQDDMTPLYHKLMHADAIVFASPIYWFGITAQMKLFIDRFYGLWLERTAGFAGKTFAAVLVYGDEDPLISGAVNAIHMFEDAARYCKARLAGVAYGTANDIGDAEQNSDLCRKAKELGMSLL